MTEDIIKIKYKDDYHKIPKKFYIRLVEIGKKQMQKELQLEIDLHANNVKKELIKEIYEEIEALKIVESKEFKYHIYSHTSTASETPEGAVINYFNSIKEMF